MSDSEALADWELGKLVHDLDMQLNARMRERATKIGLTTAQASALRELTAPMTVSELAGRMSCEPSNAIVVIDKLESQQLIERRPHPSDRRAKHLTLTPDGAALRKKLLRLLSEEPLMLGLTPQEHRSLREILQRATTRH
jgi:DNA-binding MarR family transcriptional regulator